MTATLALAAGLLVAIGARGNGPPPESPPADARWVMGTLLTVEVRHDDPALATRARDAAFAEAQRLDDLLSHYQPDSPLSRLNERAGQGPVPVPLELANWLDRARKDARRTDGAFDVTVGALVRAYREGADANALEAALATVGVERIELGPLPMTDPPAGTRPVALPAGTALDPGGNGKGVAVDAMLRTLQAHGVETAFVNFGESSFGALGSPGPEGWQVALRGPSEEYLGTVTLDDLCLSASSALPPTADDDGSRRGHVVDPRTGELVGVPRTAVVLSPSATDAEVLSTALIVEGRAGARWLERFPEAHAAVFEPGSPPWLGPGFQERFAAGDAPDPAVRDDAGSAP